MEYKRLHRFKGIDVAEESTDSSEQTLRYAENVVLRPRGAVSRMPPFRRLWGLQALQNYAEQLEIDPATDKTCLLSIRQPQGTNNASAVFLVAHDFKNQKGLGLFCAVDLAASNKDISLDTLFEFLPQNAAPPPITTTIQVLKKGLAENQRWFFYRFYDSIVLGNGVDENLIYQHARETLRLRTMGTDLKPAIPSVVVEPSVIQETVQASIDVRIITSSTNQALNPALKISANPTSFLGSFGNNIVFRLFQGTSTGISSIRSGQGTPESPLTYIVYQSTEAIDNTANKIVEYINRDPLANGVLKAAVVPGPENDRTFINASALPDPAQLKGGITGSNTANLIPANTQIATSFYDPGIGAQGLYTTFSDPDTVTALGVCKVTPASNSNTRFTKILIWAKLPNQTRWLLLGETLNQPNQTFIASLPNNYDDAVFSEGFAVTPPPPCTMFELCEGKLFASGNPENPTRVFYSPAQNRLSLIPENMSPVAYLEMGARKEEGSGTQITHLKQMDQRLQVHTSRGITLIHGRTFVRTFARSDFGALNPAAATAWSHHISPYLGADGVLYEMANQQALKSGVASAASWDYIRSFADTAEMQRNPWRANVAGDLTNQLVWVWLPCKLDGTTRLAGFLFDYETKGFAGPITWPGLISTTKLSAVDPRIVGQTEDGNLVFIDSTDINRDEFQPNELLAGNFLAVSPNKLIFQTQLMDFGIPHEQKGYLELMFGVARGSFAENIVITLETDEGRSKVFNFGQLRGERNKCAFMLSGYAVRITFEVTLNANRPFVLRDLVLGYRRQKIR